MAQLGWRLPSGARSPPQGAGREVRVRAWAAPWQRRATAPQPARRTRAESPAPTRFRPDDEEGAPAAAADEATYRALLKSADALTFGGAAPAGGDGGGAARGGEARPEALAEAEQLLARALALRPRAAGARVQLLRNLMVQGEPRVGEVPGGALDALGALEGLCGEGSGFGFSPALVPAMQLVLLGLKALWADGRQGEVPRFLAAAAAAAPCAADDFASLAYRLEGTLAACPAVLLSPRWLSCIDLAGVAGAHHTAAPALGGGGEGGSGDGGGADAGACPAML